MVRTTATCNDYCRATTVHHPGKAKTLDVKWARYPYAHQKNWYASDPWGSTERQCVGYVTWALNAMGEDFGRLDRGPSGRVVHFFNGRDWGTAARQGGWTVSKKPVVGAVAQWNNREISHFTVNGFPTWMQAGSFGHVAIVTKVYPDSTVQVSQYNYGVPGRDYSSVRVKAPRYLHIGVK